MDNESTGNKQLHQNDTVAANTEYERPEVQVFAMEDVVRFGGITGFDGVEGAFN